ncbi:hypothetical protein KZ470_09635, partial [Glaesserella parasuis]|nr:hypothetical protein [Glaesserella parasuis]
MQLQNQQHNQELQVLISKANEATATFNQIQDKATEIQTNIDRNKKMTEALKNENVALQSESDKITFTETGEVDFSSFDDYSNKIFVNNRKIEALEKVIKKFENELDLLLLTDYDESYRLAKKEYNSALSHLGFNILEDLLIDEVINKLNLSLFTLKRGIGETHTVEKIKEIMLSKIKEKLDDNFESDIEEVSIPLRKFSRQIPSVFQKKSRITELKESL